MNKKAMKARRKAWITWGAEAIWIADEYAIGAETNRALLDMLWAKPKLKKSKRKEVAAFYMNAYAEEEAKAFIHTPDPEHPVQFVGPRSLEKAVVGPSLTRRRTKMTEEVWAKAIASAVAVLRREKARVEAIYPDYPSKKRMVGLYYVAVEYELIAKEILELKMEN